MSATAIAPVSKLPGVGTTIFTVMSELAREHGALNLSQGFPDFDGPRYLLERVQHYLTHGHNQYAPMMGVPALRQAVADKVLDLYGCGVDPDTRSPSPPAPRKRCSVPSPRW
jgi:methionine transaminase